ncbi:hypothetical protein LJR016_005169 [Devosia sp. LjRoot16]|uniref:hypothetical protein n=1 Tax=Devosia sp. LjRoot16 TaxID=3342271 RepID=UPI003ED0919E
MAITSRVRAQDWAKVSIAAAIFLMGVSSGASAQDRTIEGKPVPDDQVAAVEKLCAELQLQQGATGTQEPETSMDQTTEDKLKSDAEVAGELDLSSITLEQCVTGGFVQQGTNTNQ